MQRALNTFAIVATIFLGYSAAFGAQRFVANLSGRQAVPPNTSARSAVCSATLSPVVSATGTSRLDIRCTFGQVFPLDATFSVHKAASVGETSPAVLTVPAGRQRSLTGISIAINDTDLAPLRANEWYFLISTPEFPQGELRGQVKLANGTYNDYDGDGLTDLQVYRNSEHTFYAQRSTDGTLITQPLGQQGDSVSLTVDFDGDGLSDFSTARYASDVVWRVLQSTTANVVETHWGSSSLGDFFASADYDGDGQFEIAVYRAGTWYIIDSSTGAFHYETWGTSGDIPAPNDFDLDGKADLTVARSESGQRVWYTRLSSTGEMRVVQWGLSSDGLFAGRCDFDGDSVPDLLVIRNVSGQRIFYIRRSSDAQMEAFPWGSTTDVVKLGDYDGDGRTDPAVTRAVNGQRVFYILQSSNGVPRIDVFGLAGDF